MAPEIRVHLTRHGEVDNPEGILYGRIPGFGLTERGHRMAANLGEHYSDPGFVITRLVVSPLQRARETMAPIAEATGLTPRVDERVIEARNDFEGQKVNPRTLSRPGNLRRLYNPFKPSWGEAYVDQLHRMLAAVFTLRSELERDADHLGLSGIDGVIVSHQLPIWVTRLNAENRSLVHDPRARECALASVTSLTFEAGTLTRVKYENVNAELQPIKAVSGA